MGWLQRLPERQRYLLLAVAGGAVLALVTLMRRDSTGKTTAETFTTVERIPDFVLDFKGPEQPKK